MREACEFFSTDVMNEASAPVTQSGYKEGYLTKRGKNFGGYVLTCPSRKELTSSL